MKNILVTGGAGFIGSHIVDRLLMLGYSVTVIDNESTDVGEDYYWNSQASNHTVSITDYNSIRPLFDGIDTVFHLAAQNRIQKSLEHPEEAFLVNTIGTNNVLMASREAGVKRVIYSSTSSIYGRNPLPNHEGQPDHCLNPYSISKYAGEQLCSMYYNQYGLETIILRYFNVYGERHREVGQYSPVIATFMRQKRDGLPLTVSGDGSQRRDFTNVEDVVSANLLAASVDLVPNLFGTVFNIGAGNNYSIKELADLISDYQVKVPAKDGEVLATLADSNKARQILGWSPSVLLEEWIKERL